MGKRIEDLQKFDLDQPIERQVEALEDLRDQPWFQFVGKVDELLDQAQYSWAVETLTGIRETVERTHRITEGQQRAVQNIESGVGRRYQGWYGRRR